MSGFINTAAEFAQTILASITGGADILQLDSIVFDESALEVPEHISGLGGTQVIAQHDFPGGARTQQVFGAFPDPITWRAFLTGSNAFARMLQIDQIRKSGRVVFMRYGPKSYQGTVASFDPVPHHRWLIPYTIRFLPLVDLSDGDQGADTSQVSPEAQLSAQQTGAADIINTSDPNGGLTVIQPGANGGAASTTYGPDYLTNGAATQSSTNTVDTTTQNLVSQTAAAGGSTLVASAPGGINTVQTFSPGFSLPNPSTIQAPGAIVAPSIALQNAVTSQMAQANGIVDNVGVAGATLVQSLAAQVNQVAAVLATIPTSIVSYSSALLGAYATNIAQIMTHPIFAPSSTIQVMNPNFPSLAAQYLGDANRWRDIAYFNGLSDPMPLGFYVINIPNPNISPIPQP